MLKKFSKLVKFQHTNPLAYRLVFYILICSLFFTLSTTVFQLYVDYHKDMKLIEERLQQIQESYVPGLSNSVWYFDTELIETQLNGILQLPDIQYLEVRGDNDKRLISVGTRPTGKTIIRQTSLERDNKEKIGSLYIVASLQRIDQRFNEKVLVILITQAFTIFLLSICILFIFQSLVTRHLNKMAQFAQQVSITHLDTPLMLKRTLPKKHTTDELDRVVNAINTMRISLSQDITRRKQAEDALKDSEARFRAAFESAKDCILIWDKNYNYLYANQAAIDHVSTTRDKVIGKNIRDALSHIPDFMRLWMSRVDRIFETGEAFSVQDETMIQGQRFFTDSILTPIYNQDGHVSAVCVVYRDITEHKLTEKAMHTREAFLDRVIDQSPFATWISDEKGTLQRANPALKKFLNLTDEQLVGKYNALKDPLLERQGLMPLFHSVYEEGKSINFTCDWDGNDIPNMDLKGSKSVSIEATMFPIFNSENKLTNVVLNWIDITERKQAEEKLRKSETEYKTTLNNLLVGVVVHATDTSVLLSNQEAHKILGLTEEQMTGKKAIDPAWNFVDEDLTEIKIENYPVNKVISTKKPLYNYNLGINRPDRVYVTWVNVNAIPVFSENYELEKIIINFVDITEIKQMQNTLVAKNKELENYLYVASHDLRAPLVNIQGFSQRLQKQTDAIKKALSEYPPEPQIKQQIEKMTDEGIPKSLNFILTGASKMDALIKGLLKISRTGKVKMTIQKIDMNKMMEKIIRAFHFQIEKAAAETVVEKLPDCYGDAAMLDQLFSNLFGNALKYRDENKQLVVSVAALTRYDKIIYSIKDTGVGIAPRHLEKIWDVFYQADSQAPEAGEGIGLSVVKTIADKHKGTIRVESEEGRGSVFYIELPKNEFAE